MYKQTVCHFKSLYALGARPDIARWNQCESVWAGWISTSGEAAAAPDGLLNPATHHPQTTTVPLNNC